MEADHRFGNSVYRLKTDSFVYQKCWAASFRRIFPRTNVAPYQRAEIIYALSVPKFIYLLYVTMFQ